MTHRRTALLVLALLAPVLAAAAAARAQGGSELFLIDFEDHPESTQISTQYAAGFGATFSIVGDPALLPVIAVEGSPRVAFDGAGVDAPMSSGAAGLTDPVLGGDPFADSDIAVAFDPPVTSVRLFIIDIDGTETATVRAFDGATEVAVQSRTAGQAGTGNAVSSEFLLSADSITSIVVDVSSSGAGATGYALDFLTFTRPCPAGDCGPAVRLAQESAPGAADFDQNILGDLVPYLTTASAAGFYAYDVPEGDSWNGPSLTPIADRSHLLLAHTTDGLTLFHVHDRAIPDDPNGGRAEVRYEIAGDPDGAFISVQDDPTALEAGAGYTGDPGDSVFTTGLQWNTCCTDGVALSGLDGPWVMSVAFTEVDSNASTPPIQGMTELVAYSADGSQIPLALETGRRIRLELVLDTCRVDVNGDEAVNSNDISAFLTTWLDSVNMGNLAGDFNHDFVVNSNDISSFLSAWLLAIQVGC